MTVKHVSQKQYDQIGQLILEANNLVERSRQPGLTLAQKLDLQRRAKACREEALRIGK